MVESSGGTGACDPARPAHARPDASPPARFSSLLLPPTRTPVCSPLPASRRPQAGFTPLIVASLDGRLEAVDRLIAARADIQAKTNVRPSLPPASGPHTAPAPPASGYRLVA